MTLHPHTSLRPRAANASELAGDGNGFVQLFLNEQEYEEAQQDAAVVRVFAAQSKKSLTPQQASLRAPSVSVPSLDKAAEASAPKQNPKVPTAPSAHLSPYVNPRPIQVKRAVEAMRAKLRSADGSRPVTASYNTKERIARDFFRQLPPVVARRPTTALQLKHGPKWVSSRVSSADLNHAPSKEQQRAVAPDVITSPSFYFLHVKVEHSVATLGDWEFSVSVSDVTFPERILRHTFRNLHVNSSNYIVFHPPSNIVLSPAEDIPWVASPESLYEHSLRIEVLATYPSQTKVVDTFVYFGDRPQLALAVPLVYSIRRLPFWCYSRASPF